MLQGRRIPILTQTLPKTGELMFLCLTNHQPKPSANSQQGILPPSLLAILSGRALPFGEIPIEEGSLPIYQPIIPKIKRGVKSKPSKPVRNKIPSETPKDGASIYLNIESHDVVALIPTRFGGTELVYLALQQSANIPEGMGKDTLLQKTRMSILVKEPPSYIANQLGIVAKGA